MPKPDFKKEVIGRLENPAGRGAMNIFLSVGDISKNGLPDIVVSGRMEKHPIITPRHAYHVLEIMIRGIESAKEGQFKEVKSTFSPPVFRIEVKEEESHLVHDRTTGRR